ncbi:hypothetical protein JCM10908_005126 [Rhodotorula pacifica]|uniref:GNAT family N-acetyltransferase n=1 Tax=Rhodotorula pacifica TaxID=1495444 RepID=UPI0031730BBA
MTTVILPLEKDDYSAAATIQHEAFADDPISGLIWGGVDPAEGHQEQINTFGEMAAEPWRTLRKAVRKDGEGKDEIVAISVSGFIDASEKRKMKNDAPPAKGTNVQLLEEFYGMMGELVEGYKKRDPKFYHLTILVVSPKAQRTGAGAALLRELVEEADAADLPCYLESSDPGEGLYRKYGFVERAERPRRGPDGLLTVLPMRRPAKSESA